MEIVQLDGARFTPELVSEYYKRSNLTGKPSDPKVTIRFSEYDCNSHLVIPFQAVTTGVRNITEYSYSKSLLEETAIMRFDEFLKSIEEGHPIWHEQKSFEADGLVLSDDFRRNMFRPSQLSTSLLGSHQQKLAEAGRLFSCAQGNIYISGSSSVRVSMTKLMRHYRAKLELVVYDMSSDNPKAKYVSKSILVGMRK